MYCSRMDTEWMAGVGEKLLENAQETIQPPPQRIIRCYGQWKPLYFEMLESIPEIEFCEGVPDDFKKSSFLDVIR